MQKLIVIMLLSVAPCFAWDTIRLDVPKGAKESVWRDALAVKWYGRTETVIPGGRIDVETALYVAEIDFARKWTECFGQTLFYADSTGKQGVAVLIVDNPELMRQKLDLIEKEINRYDLVLVVLTRTVRNQKGNCGFLLRGSARGGIRAEIKVIMGNNAYSSVSVLPRLFI